MVTVRIIYSQALEAMRLERLAGRIGTIDGSIQHPKHGKYVTVRGLPPDNAEWFIPNESIHYVN